jgi:hypothetical protein
MITTISITLTAFAALFYAANKTDSKGLQIADRVKVRHDEIMYLHGTNKPVLIKPDMVLIVRKVQSDRYLFRVACNFETLFCEKKLHHATNGSTVWIDKNDFLNYRMI